MAGMLGCGGGPEILFPFRCFEAAGLEEAQAIIVIKACRCNPIQDYLRSGQAQTPP